MAPHFGHFWMTIAAAFLCVLRARFSRFEVLRFGTAMECLSSAFPGVTALALVQVQAARRAQPLAVGAEEHEGGHIEEPLFTQCRAQIHLRTAPALVQRKDIGVVFAIGSGLDEYEVCFTADHRFHFDQTATALTQKGTGELAAEVVPPLSCFGESAGHPDAVQRALIALQPDLVVGV